MEAERAARVTTLPREEVKSWKGHKKGDILKNEKGLKKWRECVWKKVERSK